jgi:hypothetical protein
MVRRSSFGTALSVSSGVRVPIAARRAETLSTVTALPTPLFLFAAFSFGLFDGKPDVIDVPRALTRGANINHDCQ